MSANPLTAKIAAPYARALFDFSVEKILCIKLQQIFKI
jgi:F0F1-type ATP synthase delta subunit